MKLVLLLTLIMGCQFAFAQSKHDLAVKKEMLERVDLLIQKAELIRQDLKKEDVVKACEKVNEMFEIYPDHLKAIGRHLDLFDGKSNTAQYDTLYQLSFIHRQTLICRQGKDSEHVDMGALSDKMKEIRKSLSKQRKIIKKSDTNFENSFEYEYEF